jgi:hypothetical protein
MRLLFGEIYYWMTTRLSKIPTNDNPPFNAYFLIAFLQSFNLGTIFIFINYFAQIKIPKNTSVITGLILAAFLFTINHITLYSKRTEIFKKYENMNSERKRKGLIWFWIYTIISTASFFASGALLVNNQ